jgi:hypothetical protein
VGKHVPLPEDPKARRDELANRNARHQYAYQERQRHRKIMAEVAERDRRRAARGLEPINLLDEHAERERKAKRKLNLDLIEEL